MWDTRRVKGEILDEVTMAVPRYTLIRGHFAEFLGIDGGKRDQEQQITLPHTVKAKFRLHKVKSGRRF